MSHPITVTVTDESTTPPTVFTTKIEAYSPQGAAQLAASVQLEKWEWTSPHEFADANGEPIVVGGWYYDNNLDIVQVTHLADMIQYHENERRYVAWHRHDSYRTAANPDVGIVVSRGGTSDDLRLAARNPFTGKCAADEAERLGYVAHAAASASQS
jgi:hypothetical protein